MRYSHAILLCAIILGSLYISFKANKYPEKLIWSDMEGYYVYLPAVIIHGGFEGFHVKDTGYLKTWPGTNKIYTKYTSGVALLASPFFLGAHLLSKPLGYKQDGYSLIYSYALMISAVFYLVVGFVFLWKLLIKHFTQLASILALGGILYGTNLYYYAFFQPSMSHVYSFFLFSFLLWISERVSIDAGTDKKSQLIYWILLGLVSGLIVLVRPTGILVLLYPFYKLWKENDHKLIDPKFLAKHLLIAGICFILIWIPQLVYWYSVTGKLFIWSYGEESFKYWQEPKLIRVLIDPWNGWLLYSPIVIIPLAGLFMKSKYKSYYNKIVGIILICATWLFASWWAWWFGGAFGHRSYVEYGALLALPFAQIITIAFRKNLLTILFMFFYLFFIYYNLRLTYLYEPPWDGPSWTYERLFVEIKKIF